MLPTTEREKTGPEWCDMCGADCEDNCRCMDNPLVWLDAAADLVRRYMSTLNTGTKVCECCDAVRWDNRDDYQDSLKLESAAQKIERLAAGRRGKGLT